MQRINYDFTGLEDAVSKVKQNPSNSNLNSLKLELNRFWKDRPCKEIIYTNNRDKLFFGMCVIPVITINDTKTILTTNDKVNVNEYYLEIDSKLFELGLTTRELTAVLLHEVGHIVNTSEPVEAVRDAINTYYAQPGKQLPSLSCKCREILLFGIRQSIRKFKSIFDNKNEEYIADEFSVRCGYGKDLESAVKKIVRNIGTLANQVDNKFIALQWSIRLWTELKFRRLNDIKALNKLCDMTGSELEKRELRNLIRVLKDFNMSSLSEGMMVNESFVDRILDKASNAYKSFKYKGMRGLEDDLYELNMRVENTDDEEDALIILRSINLRIAMIDDYILEQNKHLSESERNRWFDLKNKYLLLREKLANKKTYKDKYYGLFVKTPVVSSRYE